MTPYRVLSIDGGGIRGLITIILLQRLTNTPGLSTLLGEVDLIAGTSTGGLLALGIANQLPLSEIRDLYVNKGPLVFEDSIWDDIVNVGRLFGAEYNTDNLETELKRLVGDKTLGDLARHVLITTFDLDNENMDGLGRRWKPKLFHNFEGENSDKDVAAYKVGLYTAAAPTYFPTVDGYIDGGVYANNPSMCALAQTQDGRYQPVPPLDDVVLFSLGTGKNLTFEPGQNLDWGFYQWVRPLITLIFDGVTGIADYQCHQILRDRYHRLAPVLPPDVSVPLDAVDKIDYMIEFANTVPLDDTIAWLETHWV